jgi:hypothetical protein
MKPRILTLALLLLLSLSARAQNNPELAQMFAADQAARSGEIDWEVVTVQDAERRTAVLAILASGEVRTALDYYNAAMIFQHGDSTEDIRLAHAFATVSSTLGSSAAANWLKAASWDRLLQRFEQPQWYGTQYVRDNTNKWVLYPVQPDVVTDEQRAEWSVPSLEEAQSRVEAMNGNR